MEKQSERIKEINETFSCLIRDKMSEEQFWKWVQSWKCEQDICENAEDWNTETKRREIKAIEKMIKEDEEAKWSDGDQT